MLNSGEPFIAKIFQGPGLDALIAALKRPFQSSQILQHLGTLPLRFTSYAESRPHHGSLKQAVTEEIEGALSKLGIVMQVEDEEDIVPQSLDSLFIEEHRKRNKSLKPLNTGVFNSIFRWSILKKIRQNAEGTP